MGIVTIDDAISILQDEASEDIAKMNAIGPSDKPYFKQSLWDLYKSRAPGCCFDDHAPPSPVWSSGGMRTHWRR